MKQTIISPLEGCACLRLPLRLAHMHKAGVGWLGKTPEAPTCAFALQWDMGIPTITLHA